MASALEPEVTSHAYRQLLTMGQWTAWSACPATMEIAAGRHGAILVVITGVMKCATTQQQPVATALEEQECIIAIMPTLVADPLMV